MRSGEHGVTLIEMLVVLSVLAIGAGVVSYALPPQARPQNVAREADLLAARLDIAAERSLIGGAFLALDWQDDGYGFQTWDGQEWGPAGAAPLDARHTLRDGITLSDDAGRGDGRVRITPALMPPQDGSAQVRIASGGTVLWVTFDGAAARVTEQRP